jgi:LacI family transcriptional regulator
VINNSGYIRESTRRRVEQAIEELEYVPNALASSLRFNKTNMIALVVTDITNPFWTTITRGVEDACSECGMNVILCNTDERPDKEENYINVLLQKQTDGFLLAPVGGRSDIVRKIQKRGVPIVVIDRQIPSAHVDVVRSDSEDGAYRLTRYLLELGHRRIAILSVSSHISTGRQRVDGYRRAFVEQGAAVDPALILHGEYKGQSGYQMTVDLMQHVRPLPTAIFAGNNFIAVGVLNALHDLGFRVPDDVSVVAFDDLPYATEPFVTVAAQSPYELGLTAANLLIDIIAKREPAGTRDIVLPVELITRRSCRALLPEPILPDDT